MVELADSCAARMPLEPPVAVVLVCLSARGKADLAVSVVFGRISIPSGPGVFCTLSGDSDLVLKKLLRGTVLLTLIWLLEEDGDVAVSPAPVVAAELA